MTVPARRTRKPSAIDETARIAQIVDWLVEDIARRRPHPAVVSANLTVDQTVQIYAVAERIAARTAD